ncbi:MAG: AAA family ATPase [Phycisphaerales bacterium]|nr:AAA family ATPase [Phycisphaerales bacterium]
MKIESITVTNFGPFLGNHTLRLEPGVTVLTGANDTGKSSLIDVLALVCSGSGAGNHQVNVNRAGTPHGSLNDSGMCVELTVEVLAEDNLADLPGLRPAVTINPGDRLTLVRALGPNHHLMASRLTQAGGVKRDISFGPMKPWRVVRLPGPNFRATVPLANAAEPEGALFRCLFGQSFAELPKRVAPNWVATVRGKESKINEWLRVLLPEAARLEVHLTPEANGQIHVSLLDTFDAGVSLDQRGGGIRKTFAILGPLLEAQLAGTPTIVLLDEPETSLHADAQHQLREFLERIGHQPLVQVVYATHSASMINNMREESVRVLRRKKTEGGATSFIEALDGDSRNFAPVRCSLGITPSDSLLYADLTFIVEGKTEVRCLPSLLRRLEEGDTEGFKGVKEVLKGAHLFDGEGDSLDFSARFAESNGCRVVVLLDGDKHQRKGLSRLQSDHPEIPVIRLQKGSDFESLIARDDYFKAVASELAESEPPDINAESKALQIAFEQWLSQQECRSVKEAVFGKQVQIWLNSQGYFLSKYAIMERAVASPDLNLKAVRLPELAALVAAAKKSLGIE